MSTTNTDPRKSFPLPEGFIWSRRLEQDWETGRWCIVYDSRWTAVVGRPTAEWNKERVEEAIEKMRNLIRNAEEETQIKFLLKNTFGSV